MSNIVQRNSQNNYSSKVTHIFKAAGEFANFNIQYAASSTDT